MRNNGEKGEIFKRSVTQMLHRVKQGKNRKTSIDFRNKGIINDLHQSGFSMVVGLEARLL